MQGTGEGSQCEGQEQLHSGLLRPDGIEAPAIAEARQVAKELESSPSVSNTNAKVALVFDYDADAAWQVQPHGTGLSYFGLVFDVYRAMRALGLSIDIVPPSTRDFDAYRIVAAPGLLHASIDLKAALSASAAEVLLGPRSCALDADMGIPNPLPPDFPGLELTVSRIESLRPDMPIELVGGGQITGYRKILEGNGQKSLISTDGKAVVITDNTTTYIGAWLDQAGWKRVLSATCERVGISVIDLPDGVRRRDTGTEEFWFNYENRDMEIEGRSLGPLSVTRVAS